jgi:UDP-glucuronate 4-epimerase
VAAVKPILVTGAAGFIGFHLARRLLEQGRFVVGLDNLNSYYDPKLKEARLAELEQNKGIAYRGVHLDGDHYEFLPDHQRESEFRQRVESGFHPDADKFGRCLCYGWWSPSV